MKMNRKIAVVGMGIALLALSACSDPRETAVPPAERTALPAELAVQLEHTPAGITPQLWRQLAAELERVLEEQGTARRTSAVPTGEGSKVLDFGIYFESAPDYNFRWTYRNQGDYDANGVVTISDLTPVGVHFGKRFGDSGWSDAQRADGDNNGEINISDVTPIGVNFGGQVDGYVLQIFSAAEQDFVDEEVVPLDPADSGAPEMNYFWADAPLVIHDMRVVPYVDLGDGEDARGIPSNIAERRQPLPTNWPMLRGHPYHHASAQVLGPSSDDNVIEIQLQGQYNEPCTPVSDISGNVFACTLTMGDDLLNPDNETFVTAVNPSGSILWSRRLAGAVITTPCVHLNGLLIVPTTLKAVYALSPEGKFYWKQPIDGLPLYGGVVFEFTGASYIQTEHEVTGNALVNKLDMGGNELWSRTMPGESNHALFVTSFGGISCFADHGVIRTTSADGAAFFDTQIVGTCDVTFVDPCVRYVPNQDEGHLLIPLEDPSELQARGLGISNDFDYDPLGKFEAGPTFNFSGQAIVPVTDDVDDKYYLRLVNTDGSVDWSRLQAGKILHYVASDVEDRMYYCVRIDDGDGTYSGRVICFGANQSELWSIDYPGRVPYAPIISGPGRMAFMLANLDNPDDTSLVLVSD